MLCRAACLTLFTAGCDTVFAEGCQLATGRAAACGTLCAGGCQLGPDREDCWGTVRVVGAVDTVCGTACAVADGAVCGEVLETPQSLISWPFVKGFGPLA